jgi:hypothetical protein
MPAHRSTQARVICDSQDLTLQAILSNAVAIVRQTLRRMFSGMVGLRERRTARAYVSADYNIFNLQQICCAIRNNGGAYDSVAADRALGRRTLWYDDCCCHCGVGYLRPVTIRFIRDRVGAASCSCRARWPQRVLAARLPLGRIGSGFRQRRVHR